MKYITVKLTENQHRTVIDMVMLERIEQEDKLRKGFTPQYFQEQIAYLKRLETTLRKGKVS